MHAIWLKNCSSTHALDGKTLYEMLFWHKPKLLNLPMWGFHVKVHTNEGSKLDMHACKRCWVSFDWDSSGHQIYLEDTWHVAIE
ncbi:hypothetical protein ID866_9132 [Astraeus odoratus]|nr:hypothetical protein ID866_9132 [Astraeus odoratus]